MGGRCKAASLFGARSWEVALLSYQRWRLAVSTCRPAHMTDWTDVPDWTDDARGTV